MSTTAAGPAEDLAPRPPTLLRNVRVGATVIAGAICALQVGLFLLDHEPWGVLVPVALGVAGLVVGRSYPTVGLVLLALAPVVAADERSNLIIAWSLTVFGVLVLTARGCSSLLAASVAGIGNLMAVWFRVRTVDVTVDPTAAIACVAAVAAAATGSAVLNHHRYVVELQRRAYDAVITRRTAVERGVAEERLRIARDLHDAVGHHVAAANMNLGAAEIHLPPAADRSREELAAVRGDLQAVLADLQHILRILRAPDDSRGSLDDPAAVTPSHQRLGELVETFREGGVAVDVTLGALPGDLDPELSAAVFRIVQELLTNAARHGSGGVTLRTAVDAGALHVLTTNRVAPGAPARPGSGLGLIGLRERAGSVGGTVDVEATDQSFGICVRLPLDPEGDR